MKRIAIYARVSSDDQDEAMQLSELRAAAEGKGEVVEYIDHDVSSGQAYRPKLEEMKKDVRRGRIKRVMVYRFDRFARSVKELLFALDEFTSLGVEFMSIHEAIDTGTPVGRLMFTIIAAFAEFERNLIKQRTRSGMAEAKRKGKHIGRPSATVDIKTAEGLIRAGWSVRKAAKEIGVNFSTLRRRLNDAGLGHDIG